MTHGSPDRTLLLALTPTLRSPWSLEEVAVPLNRSLSDDHTITSNGTGPAGPNSSWTPRGTMLDRALFSDVQVLFLAVRVAMHLS
jgi:hypothetical protein